MDVQNKLILRISNLTKNFGGLTAVNNVSADLERGEIHGLIGPNGSGKTTLINTITGSYRASGGTAIFKGKDIIGINPRIISEFGISRTFQISRIFSRMTVLENLLVVAPKGGLRENREGAMDLLEQVGLENMYDKIANSLPYGQRKLLEFARSVMTKPELIFLDEPTAGVNSKLIEKMVEFVHSLNDKGMTFVVVEHNMRLIMSLCRKIFVLEHGNKIAEGTPTEVQNNSEVIRAYLGEGNDQ